jgi:hypothetical protein
MPGLKRCKAHNKWTPCKLCVSLRGVRGGRSRSKKKAKASRENLRKANAARIGTVAN